MEIANRCNARESAILAHHFSFSSSLFLSLFSFFFSHFFISFSLYSTLPHFSIFYLLSSSSSGFLVLLSLCLSLSPSALSHFLSRVLSFFHFVFSSLPVCFSLFFVFLSFSWSTLFFSLSLYLSSLFLLSLFHCLSLSLPLSLLFRISIAFSLIILSRCTRGDTPRMIFRVREADPTRTGCIGRRINGKYSINCPWERIT